MDRKIYCETCFSRRSYLETSFPTKSLRRHVKKTWISLIRRNERYKIPCQNDKNIKVQNLNKDKEKICTNDTEKNLLFLTEILFIYSLRFRHYTIPFRISRLILEHHLSNILLVDKRSRLLRKMHL